MVNEARHIQNRNLRTDLLVLGISALALRLLYLFLALDGIGLESLSHFAPDTWCYREVAECWLSGRWQTSIMLLKVGPGYGLMLAVIKLLLGPNPIFLIALNIILGSLAPLVVYLIAHSLFHRRSVSLMAGAISCVSLTSVALSSQILTDQPFYTFFASSLLTFIWGIQTARWRWFIIAGLLAGWSAWIRSTGVPCIFLFAIVPFLMPKPSSFRTRWHLIGSAGVTVGIMLVFILSWSWRNWKAHDLFTFGTNGVMSMRSYLMPLAVCSHTPDCELRQLGQTWSIEDGDDTEPPAIAYARAEKRVLSVFREHPRWVVTTYFKVIHDNIRNMNTYLWEQIPVLKPFTLFVYQAMALWLAYLIMGAAVIGFVLMLLRKYFFAAVLLGLAFAYFTAITGFSFFQGSRLHFPAEMAWSILVAFASDELYRFARRLIRRQSMAPTVP